jgi:hypothetical protein
VKRLGLARSFAVGVDGKIATTPGFKGIRSEPMDVEDLGIGHSRLQLAALSGGSRGIQARADCCHRSQ